MGPLINYNRKGLLPKIKDKTRIVDIGVGGGQGISEIKKAIFDVNNTEIIGIDVLLPAIRAINKPENDVFGVVADMAQIPLIDDSVSAINLSSVLHEGLSYNDSIISGIENTNNYISRAFKDYLRILVNGGYIFYRDVGSVKDRERVTEVIYSKEVSNFVSIFLKYFLDTFTKLCPDHNMAVGTNGNDGSLKFKCTQHLHREIQRHIITFLDLAFRQKYNIELKAAVKKMSWKEITVDEFMQMMYKSFESGNIVEDWLKREGKEVYTYLEIQEMKKLLEDSCDSCEVVIGEETLRSDYDKVLAMLVDKPLPDTKQSLIIKKVNK